ncbi:MAG: YceH family protein [bacterium]
MLTPLFTDVEVRVLGALIEKSVTTPDNYPLSLSALTIACNQTSNRDPLMHLEEDAVTIAVVSLRRRNLVRAIQPSGSRVTKYQHLLADALNLDAAELGVLAVLMLRGAQTVGELHTRTARLAEFADLAAVETTLEALISRQPDELVARLPRRAGQKEVRYAHLLSGDAPAADAQSMPAPSELLAPSSPADEKIAALEHTVDELRAEFAALRAQFVEFQAQFQ